MLHFIRSFFIALSVYTRIPIKKTEWKEEDMRYTAAFLPAAGIFLGIFEGGLFYLSLRFKLPAAGAILLTVFPIYFTGGIHLDGFLDVSDALNSFGDREKKLAIMKDPHIGSFAVIRCAALLLSQTAFWLVLTERMPQKLLFELGAVFVLSRLFAAFAMVYWQGARKEGLLFRFSSAADKKKVRILLWIFALIFCAALLWHGRAAAGLLIGGNLLLFLWYKRSADRQFGGITGDTEGWFICVSELAGAFLLSLAVLTGM